MCREMEALRNEGIEAGRAEGRAEGKAEGRAEGRAEGKAEGQAEGREKAQLENAARMLKLNLLTYEQIAECTGLTVEKVLELAGQQTSEAEKSEEA